MGQQRTHRAIALLLAASCIAEPEADVGELSAGDTSDTRTSSAASTSAASTDAPDDGSTTGSTGADSDASSYGPVLDVGSSGPIGCTNAAEQYMYLLASTIPTSLESELHRYDPETGDLQLLGQLDCPGANHPMALTIDRDGMLWANLVTDEGFRRIYTIDPDTLECTYTGYEDPENYSSSGLAFVADAPGSEQETLYIGLQLYSGYEDGTPMELASVDLASMEANIIGALPTTNAYQVADMTGTGDGRLFAFFINGYVVMELDTTTLAVLGEHVLPFDGGSPWAFAQWGSRFYIFTNTSGGSQVRAFNPATGDFEEITADIGIKVVGAAVSTCAPFEPEG